MNKRPRHRSDEILMIPFLDILCSLIGVLVLIIVVLVIAQTQRINGRTREDVQRAEEHLRLLKAQKEIEAKYAGLAEKLQKLKELQQERSAKQQDADKLKDLLTNSEANKEKNKDSASKLQKELEDLMVEIRGLTAQEPDLRKKVQELLAEIAKIQPPEKKDAPVVVNPGGSGLAPETKVFFVDASGDKLTFFWNEKDRTVVSAVPEVIVADVAFNSFLEAVKKVPQSKIIFLLRDDGMRAYNLGAGWAQSKYAYKVEQIGKLPVPGRGDLDMRLFGKLLGNLPAPPPPPKPPTAPTPAMAPRTPPPARKPAPAPGTPMAPPNQPAAPQTPPAAPPKP
jgi:hypothetical protein